MSRGNEETYLGNIIMSRVRLARNLKGYPFRITDEKVAHDIVKQDRKSVV